MSIEQFIDNEVKSNDVVLFMKGTPQFPQCGFSALAVQALNACGVKSFFSVNVLENPHVGLIFLIPGTTETLRVSGRGLLVRDGELLESMEHRGKVPKLALAVRVIEAFFHCSKSLIRSHLWQPERWPERDGLPSLAETMVAHGKLPITVDEMAAGIEDDEKQRMY